MGGEIDSVQYHNGKFIGVGSDGGYMAPDLDDIEDGIFPVECLSDEAKTLVKAYSVLRKMEFFCAGIGAAVLCYSAHTDNWIPAILFVFTGLILGSALNMGKKALRVAIDSEAERREEIDHYRELSQSISLREYRKGADDAGSHGDGEDADSHPEDSDLRKA